MCWRENLNLDSEQWSETINRHRFENGGRPGCLSKSLDSSLTQPRVISPQQWLRGLCKVTCWSLSGYCWPTVHDQWPYCWTGKCWLLSCVKSPFLSLFGIGAQISHGGWGRCLGAERRFYNVKLLLAIACFCPRGPEKQVQPVSNSKKCVKLHANGSGWV